MHSFLRVFFFLPVSHTWSSSTQPGNKLCFFSSKQSLSLPVAIGPGFTLTTTEPFGVNCGWKHQVQYASVLQTSTPHEHVMWPTSTLIFLFTPAPAYPQFMNASKSREINSELLLTCPSRHSSFSFLIQKWDFIVNQLPSWALSLWCYLLDHKNISNVGI